MPTLLVEILKWSGIAISVASVVYLLLATIAVLFWQLQRKRGHDKPEFLPPITVLKPLCGDEPRLYEALKSFCLQDYPQFQIVFGIREGADRARRVVEQLQSEFADLDLRLVINDKVIGCNLKVCNLVNMMAEAQYDYLVVADSDVIVKQKYLQQVIQPLANPENGLVTCLYRGKALGSLASYFGALFIDGWFMPAVLVSRLLGSPSFVSGATIALSRRTLNAVGGFRCLVNHLADDYTLGQLVRKQGMRTVVSDTTVDTLAADSTLPAIIEHELRWMRTIRTLQPIGYLFSGITCGLTVPILGAALAIGAAPAIDLLLAALALRLVLHFGWAGLPPLKALQTAFLIPIRDLLVFAIWTAGFFCRRVRWRQQILSVAADGLLH